MKNKLVTPSVKEKTSLYERIRQILDAARTNVSRTVNTTPVVSNWLIGSGGLKSNALRSISLSEK